MNTDINQPEVLRSMEARVLWLATNIVHHANFVRANRDGIKVGGHQTSSASVVSVLTMLYLDFLRAGDRVSVKPHAAPVFHALQYLLGNLDRSYLPRLREFGGLQSYPSRTKDPDQVDFSTGSVGIGSIAPNFAALAHQYLKARNWQGGQPRFVSILGDAELDEGTIWEAVADPSLQGIERVLWIVDFNRQSLDRVIPGIRARTWQDMFRANGWNVIEAKYGRLLTVAFGLPHGELLRECIDELSNSAYQRLLRAPAATLRQWLPAKSRHGADLAALLDRWNDTELIALFRNLGGHDHACLRESLASADTAGRSVIFAYTLKGWNLPSAGHPQNHSALLSADQMRTLRGQLAVPEGEEWPVFPAGSLEDAWLETARRRLRVQTTSSAPVPPNTVPETAGCVHAGLRSTQQTFGVILTGLLRDHPELARHLVTVSPDVASSTNLGGWINKVGVWRHQVNPEELPADAEQSSIQWRESPQGQHIELGISESNLFMTLGMFGLTQELFGAPLVPIGTLYDPFVRRGLDAFVYGVYSGARFIVVGTPSGITLAPEGGAHQSLGCQSIGTEMPDLDSYEPCFGQELEWIFLHAVRLVLERRRAVYLRLSTRPIDQTGFPAVTDSLRLEQLRADVLRGAYRIVDGAETVVGAPVVNIFACGAVLPEALEAARHLALDGIRANVFNLTGPGPLYRDFQDARSRGTASHLEQLVRPDERSAPAVTLIDDHPHTLAWIGGALGTSVHPLGVDRFGQSGCLADLHREYRLDAAHVAETCRRAVARQGQPVSAV